MLLRTSAAVSHANGVGHGAPASERVRGLGTKSPDQKCPTRTSRSVDRLLLILKAVSLGPLHGYGVLLRIQQITRDRLLIQQGSLYPALYRLEHQGLIASEWGESENRRKAKYYRLTITGRKRLRDEVDYWERFSQAIGFALDARPEDV
jgi:PadR family transcriptional regulator PadR